jgi:8-oxo-dGTP diphosphatase
MPSYKYARPALTVDAVIFGANFETQMLEVLLIKRKDAPYKGRWALPGGFVEVGQETVQGAALRELEEEAGIDVQYLEQLFTYSAPKRDPREHVVSVAHMALVNRHKHLLQAGSDAARAEWFPVTHLDSLPKLAFDHNQIVTDGVARLRGKIRYMPVGLHMIEPFTLGDVRKLYEIVLHTQIDASNFRRKFGKFRKFLLPYGSATSERNQRYTFDWDSFNKAGSNFEL